MTRYQLAKLVQWAGELHARKRLQKVVYMLEVAGCPFDAEYTLHHYGVYSQEVARLSDDMVQLDLLIEKPMETAQGLRYSYALSDSAKEFLADVEESGKGKEMAATLAKFAPKAKELLKTDLWELEVASTIVYFRKQNHPWPDAIERTCKFKKLMANDRTLKKAETLARQYV